MGCVDPRDDWGTSFPGWTFPGSTPPPPPGGGLGGGSPPSGGANGDPVCVGGILFSMRCALCVCKGYNRHACMGNRCKHPHPHTHISTPIPTHTHIHTHPYSPTPTQHFSGLDGSRFDFTGRKGGVFALLSEPLHQVNALFDNIGEEIYDGIWMTAFGFRFADNFTLTVSLDKEAYVTRTGLATFETKDGMRIWWLGGWVCGWVEGEEWCCCWKTLHGYGELLFFLLFFLGVLLCATVALCFSSTNRHPPPPVNPPPPPVNPPPHPGITRMTPAIKSDIQLQINGQASDLLQTGQTLVMPTAEGPVTLWFPEDYVKHSDDENDGPLLFITTPYLDVCNVCLLLGGRGGVCVVCCMVLL